MLDRNEEGPDSAFSLTADELKQLCHDTRAAWQALGRASYARKPAEEANLQFRRSLYVVRDMQAGEALTPETLRSIRPGFGLPPKHYDELLGRRVNRDVSRGTAISWDLIAD